LRAGSDADIVVVVLIVVGFFEGVVVGPAVLAHPSQSAPVKA
jgi:hypothetical protein